MAETPPVTTWRGVVATIVVGCFGAYLNYQIEHDKLKSTDGYAVMAQAIKKLQADVAALNEQMDPTQKLALAQAVKPQPVAPAATIEANLALEQYKRALVVKVQHSQGRAAPAAQLPDKLDDVPAAKR